MKTQLNRPLAATITTGIVSAVCAGLVVGAAARLLMRLVTFAADHNGSFTLTGSAGIAVMYAAVMVPGGIAAAATARRIRWFVASAGSVFLLLPAVGVASDEIGETNDLTFAQWILLSAASLAVFATLVVLPVLTVMIADRFRRRLRSTEPTLVQAPT